MNFDSKGLKTFYRMYSTFHLRLRKKPILMVAYLTNFSFHPFRNYHLRVGNELSTKQKALP